MTRKVQGIALIQILLLVAITSVFALYLTQQARDQVTKAAWAQARAASEVAIHSAEAMIQFELLTTDRIITKGEAGLNYHGQPFLINDNVEVAIQDQSGLLGIHFLHVGLLTRLLTSQGIPYERARTIAAVIRDWQDGDSRPQPYGQDGNHADMNIRNGNVADMTEVDKMLDLTPEERTIIQQNTSVFMHGDLNLLTATEALIQSITNNSQITEQVISMRDNRQLDEREFRQLVNLQLDENIKYTVSNTMAIRYTATNEYFSLTRDTVVALAPYAKGQNTAVNILMDRM